MLVLILIASLIVIICDYHDLIVLNRFQEIRVEFLKVIIFSFSDYCYNILFNYIYAFYKVHSLPEGRVQQEQAEKMLLLQIFHFLALDEVVVFFIWNTQPQRCTYKSCLHDDDAEFVRFRQSSIVISRWLRREQCKNDE